MGMLSTPYSAVIGGPALAAVCNLSTLFSMGVGVTLKVEGEDHLKCPKRCPGYRSVTDAVEFALRGCRDREIMQCSNEETIVQEVHDVGQQEVPDWMHSTTVQLSQ